MRGIFDIDFFKRGIYMVLFLHWYLLVLAGSMGRFAHAGNCKSTPATPIAAAAAASTGRPIDDINICDADGNTKLICAALENNLDMVKTLLATPGIAVEKGDKYGFTPLHYAAQRGRLAMVQALIEDGGALINGYCNDWRRTPLHMAAEMGQLRVVQYLVSREALLDLLDCFDRTPLMLALVTCKLKLHEGLSTTTSYAAVARYLIKQGTRLTQIDIEENTVLYLAKQAELDDVCRAIQAKEPLLQEEPDPTAYHNPAYPPAAYFGVE